MHIYVLRTAWRCRTFMEQSETGKMSLLEAGWKSNQGKPDSSRASRTSRTSRPAGIRCGRRDVAPFVRDRRLHCLATADLPAVTPRSGSGLLASCLQPRGAVPQPCFGGASSKVGKFERSIRLQAQDQQQSSPLLLKTENR